jgi:hypothetical protein
MSVKVKDFGESAPVFPSSQPLYGGNYPAIRGKDTAKQLQNHKGAYGHISVLSLFF